MLCYISYTFFKNYLKAKAENSVLRVKKGKHRTSLQLSLCVNSKSRAFKATLLFCKDSCWVNDTYQIVPQGILISSDLSSCLSPRHGLLAPIPNQTPPKLVPLGYIQITDPCSRSEDRTDYLPHCPLSWTFSWNALSHIHACGTYDCPDLPWNLHALWACWPGLPGLLQGNLLYWVSIPNPLPAWGLCLHPSV